jgi:hypothetical protein
MRINVTRLVVILPLLAACGDDRVSASETSSESSTTNTSAEESGTQTGSESGTESGSETETGEPPSNVCDTCTEGELCVARADDACTEDFGYTLECVPAVAACENGECDPECLAEVCGNDTCTPPCGQVPGVDVWCSGEAASDSGDPSLQNCPEGEKCVAWVSQGAGAYDDTKCVPVTGDNMVGEACTMDSVIEATDDCDANGMCFGVNDDLEGFCYGFCEPGEICSGAQTCLIANDNNLELCIDNCLPHHSENCTDGTVCFAIDDAFICLPTPTLAPDAPCSPFDYCALGQQCVPADQLESCAGGSCCTDWCDTSEPDPCVQPETCEPYWPQGQAPAGLETAGVCKLG